MYVRLAFAVAAHLNPEIVILDEVLAVGDAVFQKKCFDRMEEIINEGHAAILVSHGMGNVRRMSQVCLWLQHGKIAMFGPTHEVVARYEKETTHEVVSHYEKQTAKQREPTHRQTLASLSSWSVESTLAKDLHSIAAGRAPMGIRFEIDLAVSIASGTIVVSVTDVQGLVLFSQNGKLQQQPAGRLKMLLELPWLPVRPGDYIISCTISDEHHPIAFLRATPELTVREDENIDSSGDHGLLHLPAKLSVEN
jgi:ABC-type glutathione transport system ATPase component